MRPLILAALLLFAVPAIAAPPVPDATIEAQARTFLLPCHGNPECTAAGQTFIRQFVLAMHGSHGNQWALTDWFSAPTPVPVVALSGREYCAWLWILVDGVGSHYKEIDLSRQADRCDSLPASAHAIVWRRYQALRREIHAVTGRSTDD